MVHFLKEAIASFASSWIRPCPQENFPRSKENCRTDIQGVWQLMKSKENPKRDF